jgi:hypothetical protein
LQYRLPKPRGFKPAGYVLALALRYGLVGVASSHHLLITAEEGDEASILEIIGQYGERVEDHVRWELGEELPFAAQSALPHVIGRLATLPIEAYLPLFRKLVPLDVCLNLIIDKIASDHLEMVVEGWSWWRRKKAMAKFREVAQESANYAYHFFERRQADIDEVPQIVLLGE